MKLTVDDEKLKKLDKYNLFRILEKASVGNFVRGSLWIINKLSELLESVSELPKEESGTKDKRKTENKK